MQIDVLGHSGCNIKIVHADKELLIEKSTNDREYFERLVSQAEKQKRAQSTKSSHIKVPEIYRIERQKEQVVILMKYIYSRNFIDFFESSGFEQITTFSQTIINFIEDEVSRSTITELSDNVVKRKFYDICSKCQKNSYINKILEVNNLLSKCEEICCNIGNISLPIGTCHGDLTFSNILFGESDYYLIDFLDSFIESPLIDIVKLRQDSKHMWSQLMYIGKFDEIRLKITSAKIDSILDEHFSKYQWYTTYYNQFQIINFLRILQYAHDERIIIFLINVLNNIVNEFNSSSCSK